MAELSTAVASSHRSPDGGTLPHDRLKIHRPRSKIGFESYIFERYTIVPVCSGKGECRRAGVRGGVASTLVLTLALVRGLLAAAVGAGDGAVIRIAGCEAGLLGGSGAA